MEPRFEIRYTANQKILREFYRKNRNRPPLPHRDCRVGVLCRIDFLQSLPGNPVRNGRNLYTLRSGAFAALFHALVHFVESPAIIQAE